MTKAEQIRALWEELPNTPQRTRIIADRVGCLIQYVRVVARQRKGRGMSEIDKRYLVAKFGSLKAWRDHRNEQTKERRSVYQKKRWREDPQYRKRQMESSARAKARKRAQREERAGT